MQRRWYLGAVMLCMLAFAPVCSSAHVRSIDIAAHSDVIDGAPNAAGPYERLVGTVTFDDDPSDPHNGAVTDLALAPRTAAGAVESHADLFILRPKNGGNHTALVEIANRGGKGMVGYFDHATYASDPTTAADFGDRFLLDAGYTLVWVGWQWDVPRVPGNLRLFAPLAHDGPRSISGLVRSDFTTTSVIHEQPLSHRNHLAYPVADPSDPADVLTERDGITLPRRVVPRSSWHLNADRTALLSETGFTPGHIYEFVYRAVDPVVTGLGFTAVRDLVSALRYDRSSVAHVDRAYGFGISQSARFLREMLYRGFNTDEHGRPVFDAVLADVGGAGRGGFDLRFGQPSRDGPSFSSFMYPVDLFPFTANDETDPVTQRTDGLLTHAHADRTHVKLMLTESSYEYYGRGASLLQTTPDGTRDAAPDDDTRIYFFGGGMHYTPPLGARDPLVRETLTPVDRRFGMKALLTDLDAWVRSGTPPPPSTVPTIAGGTLVAPDAIRWPAIPGFPHTPSYHAVYRLDFGPRFGQGIADREPPAVGAPYPILLPQVDADGIDLGGIRMPEVAEPLATYTGWNQRVPGIGFPEQNGDFDGAMVPFALTAAERVRTGDPRRSIAERYASKSDYLAAVDRASASLVRQRFLLPSDVHVERMRAAAIWDYVHGGASLTRPAP